MTVLSLFVGYLDTVQQIIKFFQYSCIAVILQVACPLVKILFLVIYVT